ncbi:MAG: flagellar basal body P-ring formation protein FlgA [Alphaproteobacteria bacterium]|nr:flagellar basal body P-ring formation protein FlgA [Alphaproteobacteria bacterium]
MKALILAAALSLAAAPACAQIAPVAAAGQKTVRIVVPTHNIARGAMITAGDLAYANVPPALAYGDVVADMSTLEGKEARRYLEANQPLHASDVRAPILVAKGSTVTMVFSAPGISLTAIGKAMSQGGMGETVTVLNPVSYRQISAVVTGPGTVAAGPSSALPNL